MLVYNVRVINLKVQKCEIKNVRVKNVILQKCGSKI